MKYRQFGEMQPFAPVALLRVLVIGFAAGLIMWLMMIGLDYLVIRPLFCRAESNWVCGNTASISVVTAIIISQLIGLAALVRAGTLRPLLVIIAALITLWGFWLWLAGLAWWQGALYSGLLMGLAYSLHSWVNRLTVFPVALILTIIVVVISRLVIMSF